MGKPAVVEYMDYSTINGLGRIKNAPFAALKILWVLALCASLGMITWQVVELYWKYDSKPVSTSMELKTVKKMKFPKVVICNTKPVQYDLFRNNTNLDYMLNQAAEKYGINMDIYHSHDNLFTYNYTNFDKVNVPTDLDADLMVNTAENFKMRLSFSNEFDLKRTSQPYDELVLSCTFAGKSCSKSAIGSDSTFRTYDYGLCYVFDPNGQDGISPSGEVSSSGQRYGLELLLNVDQNQSVPFVTSSSGVVICPLHDVGRYLDTNAGVFVPTGFQADIAISMSETESVPGKNTESPVCDVNSNTSVYDCLQECRQQSIGRRCGCYQHIFLFDERFKGDILLNATFETYKPCYTNEHYLCIHQVLAEFTNSTPSECKCISPCRDNFLLVRIYLKTLSYEVIKESYTYEIENFVSDIGGSLGLWAGFSVLSILELVELVFLLVAKKDNKTEPVRDETGDKNINQDTNDIELSDFD